MISNIPHVISWESLHGWDPIDWESRSDLNKYIFQNLSKNVEFMFTFRDTESYLKSVYLQMIHTGNMIKSPKHYFLDEDCHQIARKYLGKAASPCRIFCITKLDYLELFNLYTKFPNRAYAFKFDEILSNQFLVYLNLISIEELNKLNSLKQSNKYHNKSYSQIALKLTLIREKLSKLSIKISLYPK